MKFLDADHPMFRRAWVRWVTVLVPAVWSVFEFVAALSPGSDGGAAAGSPFWGILFGAAAAYAFWVLIVKGPGKGS